MTLQLYSIRELKSLLVEKQNEILVSFRNISLEGDLKLTRQPWNKGKKFGLFFDLVDEKETFQCVLWTSSREEVEKIQGYEYKKIKCEGDIVLNKIYGNFQFQVSKVEFCLDKISYLEELKKKMYRT